MDWPAEWFEAYRAEAEMVAKILRGDVTQRELDEEELDEALTQATDG